MLCELSFFCCFLSGEKKGVGYLGEKGKANVFCF